MRSEVQDGPKDVKDGVGQISSRGVGFMIVQHEDRQGLCLSVIQKVPQTWQSCRLGNRVCEERQAGQLA